MAYFEPKNDPNMVLKTRKDAKMMFKWYPGTIWMGWIIYSYKPDDLGSQKIENIGFWLKWPFWGSKTAISAKIK